MKLKIAQTLSHLMESRRITLKEISKGTGVPLSSIAEWKKNNRNPKVEDAGKVADFLGITLSHLLFGQEDRQEPLQKILKEEFFKGTFEINIKRVHIKDED